MLAGIRPSSPAGRFLLAYLGVLAVATVWMGLWVGQQVEAGLIDRNASVTALYIDSFVGPHLTGLKTQSTLVQADIDALDAVLRTTELGQSIVSFKIWRDDGTILFAGSPSLIGSKHPLDDDLERSFGGEITSNVSDLSAEENAFERTQWTRLVQTYVPVRAAGSGSIVAVVEFYQLPDALDAAVADARLRAWAVVLAAAGVAFLLVAVMIRRTGATITLQEERLKAQVDELSTLVEEVESLNGRLREAAGDTIEIATRERRRISADLHDGPAQAVALTLLQLDAYLDDPARPTGDDARIRAASDALSAALTELRQIAAGLRLPDLAPIGLGDVVVRAVEDHRRRTGTEVALTMGDLSEEAPLPVKIAVFRALQEGLSNATRHGLGRDMRVDVRVADGHVRLEIADAGPGLTRPVNPSGLGLAGIRERAALLDGRVEIRSLPGSGTMLVVILPLAASGEDAEAGAAVRRPQPWSDGVRSSVAPA